MENRDQVYDLVQRLQVMKPNKIKSEDPKAATRLHALLHSEEYAAEDKIDGCHYLMVSGLFFSKEHVEKTDNFPHLRDFFIGLGQPNLIMDGEINYPAKTSQYCVRVTGGAPSSAIDFQNTNGPIHYTIFDILRTPKGTWLQREPFRNRRKILEYWYKHFVEGTPQAEYIHLTRITYSDKERFKDDILAAGGEGVVLKKLDSLYVMGKNPMWMWMKIKQKDETDFIIMGFDPATKEYKGNDYDNWQYWVNENGIMVPVSKYYHENWIGSVRLGAYVDGQLTYVCSASGMDEAVRADMSRNADKYVNKVVKTEFMEVTEAGIPRHPRILEMHPDKSPSECTWDFTEN